MNHSEFVALPLIEKLAFIECQLNAGVSAKKIKLSLGLNRHSLSTYKRLIKDLDPEIKDLIDKHNLSEGHARALARLPGPNQDKFARDVIQRKWSVRKLESSVSAFINNKQLQGQDLNYYSWLSDALSDELKQPVLVVPSKETGAGELRIKYFSLDEFDGLMKRLRISLSDSD